MFIMAEKTESGLKPITGTKAEKCDICLNNFINLAYEKKFGFPVIGVCTEAGVSTFEDGGPIQATFCFEVKSAEVFTVNDTQNCAEWNKIINSFPGGDKIEIIEVR